MICTKFCNFLWSSSKNTESKSCSKQYANDVQANMINRLDTDIETLVTKMINKKQACRTDFLTA